MGNQKPYIEEEQTTQQPKEKEEKDEQRSTKHTYKTKDRVTRTPLKTGLNSCAPEGFATVTAYSKEYMTHHIDDFWNILRTPLTKDVYGKLYNMKV